MIRGDHIATTHYCILSIFVEPLSGSRIVSQYVQVRITAAQTQVECLHT